MAVDLFYFLSTLPMLTWGEKPSISFEQFLSQCDAMLEPELGRRVRQLHLLPSEDSGDSPVGEAWRCFETFLRDICGSLRQAKLHRSSDGFKWRETPYDSLMERRRLEEILGNPNAVEREMALDLIRWNFLDSLAMAHQTKQAELELFALRLLLLEKVSSRQLELGKEAFQKMMDLGVQSAIEHRKNEN